MDLDEMYQKYLTKKTQFIKEDVCMKFYDETKPLYIETGAYGVGLGASLLQTRSSRQQHTQTNCIC